MLCVKFIKTTNISWSPCRLQVQNAGMSQFSRRRVFVSLLLRFILFIEPIPFGRMKYFDYLYLVDQGFVHRERKKIMLSINFSQQSRDCTAMK